MSHATRAAFRSVALRKTTSCRCSAMCGWTRVTPKHIHTVKKALGDAKGLALSDFAAGRSQTRDGVPYPEEFERVLAATKSAEERLVVHWEVRRVSESGRSSQWSGPTLTSNCDRCRL